MAFFIHSSTRAKVSQLPNDIHLIRLVTNS